MAIEIVDFPIKNGDFPVRYVSHYQRVSKNDLCNGVGSQTEDSKHSCHLFSSENNH